MSVVEKLVETRVGDGLKGRLPFLAVPIVSRCPDFRRHHVYYKVGNDVQLVEVGPRFEMRRTSLNEARSHMRSRLGKHWTLTRMLSAFPALHFPCGRLVRPSVFSLSDRSTFPPPLSRLCVDSVRNPPRHLGPTRGRFGIQAKTVHEYRQEARRSLSANKLLKSSLVGSGRRRYPLIV